MRHGARCWTWVGCSSAGRWSSRLGVGRIISVVADSGLGRGRVIWCDSEVRDQ